MTDDTVETIDDVEEEVIENEKTFLFVSGMPVELKREFKLHCLNRDTTMSKAIVQLVRRLLRMQQEGSPDGLRSS